MLFFKNANDGMLLRALFMVAFQSRTRVFQYPAVVYFLHMCSVIDDAWGMGIIS